MIIRCKNVHFLRRWTPLLCDTRKDAVAGRTHGYMEQPLIRHDSLAHPAKQSEVQSEKHARLFSLYTTKRDWSKIVARNSCEDMVM